MGVVTEKIPGETKAERKARKEQIKAEKLAAKASSDAQNNVVAEEAVSKDVDAPSKRKRDLDEEDQAEEVSSELVNGEAKKSKKPKKPKNSSSTVPGADATPPVSSQIAVDGVSAMVTDSPFADTSLSEQAQKGLHYAYLHSIHCTAQPKAQQQPGQVWKFNKARQNWLAKHWSDSTEVPDKYVDLVIGYLATTVGAARQNIIKQAQQLRDKTAEVSEDTEEDTGDAAPDAQEAKPQDDAGPVAEAPAKDDTATEGQAAEQKKVTEQEVAVIEEERRRAGLLLLKMEG